VRTKVFVVLAVLLTTPCFAKIKVQEYTMPAVQGFPFRPIVQGDWALALLNTDPNKINTTIGVLAYDLKAKKVYTLHQGKADSPAITGSTVMWSGKVNEVPSLAGTTGNQDYWPNSLIRYDLTTGQYQAPRLKSSQASAPAASGEYVAYHLGSIYLYNLTTKEQLRISDDKPGHENPDIAGDLVVWLQQDAVSRTGSVRGYRISTGEKIIFTDNLKYSLHCRTRTDGQYVVWLENDSDTYVYDTKTSKVRIIPSNVWPDVSNGIAVYTRYVGVKVEGKARPRMIFGMDLKTGEEFQISQEVKDTGSRFRIEGNRVVWVEGSVLHYADLIR
jgi:TolB protein